MNGKENIYKNEIITCLEKSKDKKIISFIEKIKKDLYEDDLFLQEITINTLDIDTVILTKYIKIII
jgi:hypothetical protein